MQRQCPACNTSEIRLARARGRWERIVLPWVGIRPYCCPRCGIRFRRFAFGHRVDPLLEGPEVGDAATEEETAKSFHPQDPTEFGDLISEIREAERVLGLVVEDPPPLPVDGQKEEKLETEDASRVQAPSPKVNGPTTH